MGKQSNYNENVTWVTLNETQKSFTVRVLNWFHFRPKALAHSWTREEVLTWEFLHALKILPQRVFLSRLIERIGLRNPSCANLTAHLQSAASSIEIDEYPSLHLTGKLINRRSDIGFRHPDGTQLWLEAKTETKIKQLQQQMQDQQDALNRITGGNDSRVIALLPSVDVTSELPAISWSDVSEILEQAQSLLLTANNPSRDMDGYLLIAKELYDRIQTHPKNIVI